MSDAVGRYVSGATSVPPSRRPLGYNPYSYQAGSTEAKSFAAELGNIYRMFIDAKPGDLVLSPTVGHYDPYLIGEITGPWRKEDDLPIPLLQGEIVPARPVRWLNTALARRDFSPRVSRRLQNQHAITRLSDDLYDDIFDLVYPSFVRGNRSKLDIFGDDYTGNDPLQPYSSALLVKYVIASVFAFERGEFQTFQKIGPQAAIEIYYDKSLVLEFSQNFNSPGKFSVIAAIGSLSILASAGLYVATAKETSNFDQVRSEALQTVGQAIEGTAQGSSQAALDSYVNSMTSVNWKKVQKELGEPSNKTMPVSLDNRLEVATHRAQLDAR